MSISDIISGKDKVYLGQVNRVLSKGGREYKLLIDLPNTRTRTDFRLLDINGANTGYSSGNTERDHHLSVGLIEGDLVILYEQQSGLITLFDQNGKKIPRDKTETD